jgi:hypothetical protein
MTPKAPQTHEEKLYRLERLHAATQRISSAIKAKLSHLRTHKPVPGTSASAKMAVSSTTTSSKKFWIIGIIVVVLLGGLGGLFFLTDTFVGQAIAPGVEGDERLVLGYDFQGERVIVNRVFDITHNNNRAHTRNARIAHGFVSLQGNKESYMVTENIENFPSDELTVMLRVKTELEDHATLVSYAVGDDQSADEMVVFLKEPVDGSPVGASLTIRREGARSPRVGGHMSNYFDLPNFTNNEWHDLAFTWQSSNGRVKVYYDGQEIFQPNPNQVSIGREMRSGGTLVLGNEQDCKWPTICPAYRLRGEGPEVQGGLDDERAFAGDLDDVLIYNEVLSKDEIDTIFAGQDPNAPEESEEEPEAPEEPREPVDRHAPGCNVIEEADILVGSEAGDSICVDSMLEVFPGVEHKSNIASKKCVGKYLGYTLVSLDDGRINYIGKLGDKVWSRNNWRDQCPRYINDVKDHDRTRGVNWVHSEQWDMPTSIEEAQKCIREDPVGFNELTRGGYDPQCNLPRCDTTEPEGTLVGGGSGDSICFDRFKEVYPRASMVRNTRESLCIGSYHGFAVMRFVDDEEKLSYPAVARGSDREGHAITNAFANKRWDQICPDHFATNPDNWAQNAPTTFAEAKRCIDNHAEGRDESGTHFDVSCVQREEVLVEEENSLPEGCMMVQRRDDLVGLEAGDSLCIDRILEVFPGVERKTNLAGKQCVGTYLGYTLVALDDGRINYIGKFSDKIWSRNKWSAQCPDYIATEPDNWEHGANWDMPTTFEEAQKCIDEDPDGFNDLTVGGFDNQCLAEVAPGDEEAIEDNQPHCDEIEEAGISVGTELGDSICLDRLKSIYGDKRIRSNVAGKICTGIYRGFPIISLDDGRKNFFDEFNDQVWANNKWDDQCPEYIATNPRNWESGGNWHMPLTYREAKNCINENPANFNLLADGGLDSVCPIWEAPDEDEPDARGDPGADEGDNDPANNPNVAGDVTEDGCVNIKDVFVLANNKKNNECNFEFTDGDVTGDGCVDQADIDVIKNNVDMMCR